MKKLYFLILSFLISGTFIVANDVQFGIGGPAYNFYDGVYANIIVQNHNYFGKKKIFGISESLSISPLTADIGFTSPNIYSSLFVGPCICLPMGPKVQFQPSAGFRYFFNWYRIYHKDKYGYPEGDLLSVTDDHMFHGYSFAVDMQLKFKTTERSGFVLGMPFAIGQCKRIFIRRPKSTNPETHYITLKSDYMMGGFMDLESPYIMYCINF